MRIAQTVFILVLFFGGLVRFSVWNRAHAHWEHFCAALSTSPHFLINLFGYYNNDGQWEHMVSSVSLQSRAFPPGHEGDLGTFVLLLPRDFVGKTEPSTSNFWNSGDSMTILGHFQCREPLQNPATANDGLSRYSRSPLRLVASLPHRFIRERTSSLSITLRHTFRMKLRQLAGKASHLGDFFEAVWFGRTTQLPQALNDALARTGLVQVVALSGQHIACALLCFQTLLEIFGRLSWRLFGQTPQRLSKGYSFFLWVLPLFLGFFLCWTSQMQKPVLRATTMLVAAALLRGRCLKSSALQITLSSCALLVCGDPQLLANPSFALSASATSFLCLVCARREQGVRSALRSYLTLSLTLPLLMAPVTAYWFSHIAYAAPLAAILVSWLWDILLIPLGFCVPCLLLVLPPFLGQWLAQALERAWHSLVELQIALLTPLGHGYQILWCPTLLEWGLLEGFLITLLFFGLPNIFSRLRSQPLAHR